MSNYICIHEPSQLIQKIITSSTPPTADSNHSFHEVSVIVLNSYYALYKKALAKGVQVSVGELMNRSPSFMSQISKGKQSKVQLITTRIRKECVVAAPSAADERQLTIRDWIVGNPDASAHDLSDKFLTGTFVASAYLNKYR
ncbi:hypothetical protein [Pseudomonas sp. SG20052]|uniref:hypothetical protein n=1 Tax=Pseudomonas sp. SG20052 TaxID=3074147 RepID=UPI00287FD12A|nr:hypothetical protein [Pseudomonas sp. SG20052]WNF54032.1 hypothetical protein RHP74_22220 [Pseudomonas sp. SG20052]